MDYQIARSIEEFDEAEWDALAGDEITMTHRWQRVMEASRPGYDARYLLVRNNRAPLAVATVNAEVQVGGPGWLNRSLGRLAFGVRAPYSLGHCGVALRPEVTLAEALPQLEQALTGLCRQEKRLLLTVGNVPASDLSTWQSGGFSPTRFVDIAVLDLPPSYEQYLQALSSKQRSELRRMRRRAADQDVSFSHGPLDGDGEQLYPLLCRVYERHGTPSDAMPLKPNLFEVLEREMFGDTFVFKGLVAGQLASVFVCPRVNQKLWWWGVGLDYDLARPAYVYFLLLDEMIRWCIEQGVRRIYGGASNEREKQKQGFQLRERWRCHRATPSLLNRAFGLVLPAFYRLLGC